MGKFRSEFGQKLENKYDSLSNTTYLTIISVSLGNNIVSMEGIIDNTFSKNVTELSQKLEDKFCTQKFIGVFKIGNMEISNFTFFPRTHQSENLIQGNASERKCENLTQTERLAIIVISSVFAVRNL